MPAQSHLTLEEVDVLLDMLAAVGTPYTCDPQKLQFQSELVPADLPTLANDMKERHTAAREFSKLFKHRMQDLGTHGPNALLNTTPVDSP